MKKRILAVVLALCLALAMLPAAAFAAGSEFEMDGTVLKKYNGSSDDVVIPDGVTSIGNGAFDNRWGLYTVTIPDSVTSIGDGAFNCCTSLTSVTIPDSVTSIGERAFSTCLSLASVTIGNSVTSIRDFTFSRCAHLASVTIGNSVTSIGGNAFNGCWALTSVTISDNVTSIESSAFYDCKGLTSISVGSGNPNFTSEQGILFSKDKTVLVSYPGGKQGAYTVPDSVTSIGSYAFNSCTGLTSVTIPDSVTSIGDHAFYDCTGLTSVTIPDSVTSIGKSVFSGCTALTSVTIPDSVTSIGDHAFADCTCLTSVTIPDSVTRMGDCAFFGCAGLTSVTLPDSVTSSGDFTFSHCTSLTSVTIPDSVTSIGAYAFDDCTGLKDVYYSGSEEQWNKVEIDGTNDPLTSATIHFNSTGPDQPAAPASVAAHYTNDALTVDGRAVTPAAYKIGGANFFKLRDVAMMLNGSAGQFSVDYDGNLQAVKIVTGVPYHPQGGELANLPTTDAAAQISNNAIYINGEKVELTVYKINGENYFGIRELAQKLGFNVGWTGERGMFIESDKPYDPNN